MTAILGISAFYHDSAAAIVVDGEIVAAAQEERFTRKKHDDRFPARAVQACLDRAGLAAADLDFVGFYDKPLLKFDRLLQTYLAHAPRGYRSFQMAMPVWLQEKLFLSSELGRALGPDYKKRFVFTEHHEAHAASAFLPSPFEDAAILTLDGVGEWATASFGHGRGNRFTLSHELRFPHSIGLLYSAFTYYCGFEVNSGEYKLMGLAPYGEPRFADVIRERLIDIKEDGSFRLDLSYFNYCTGLTMTSEKFHDLFGGPPRRPDQPLTEQHMDLAASVQRVTEEVMLKAARHVHQTTGSRNLCLAGGVALNCVGNGRVLREGPFENIWIQPAAGDAGGALGVALFIWHQLLDRPRAPRASDTQSGSFLGSAFDDAEIGAYLAGARAAYRHLPDDAALCDAVADQIADGRVVGWFQGAMEFGPRALGARSILGDARRTDMQSVMNLKVKFRESFRPFAPAVLQDHVQEYFETRPHEESPYMLLVAPVRPEKRRPVDPAADRMRGIAKLGVERSVIPAATHVDYSARIQTVDPARHGLYYALIRAFYEKTGSPVIVNTSFNLGWDPIVCTPKDAYETFMSSDIDVLAIGHYVLLKAEQPANRFAGADGRAAWWRELLRCPCGVPEPLAATADGFACPACRRAFPMRDGVPSMAGAASAAAAATPAAPDAAAGATAGSDGGYGSLRSLIDAGRRDREARLLSSALPYNAAILDAGCGDGRLANLLGISCRLIVGTDRSAQALAVAERFRRAEHLSRVAFVQMDPAQPTLAPESFDVVLCSGSLVNAPDTIDGFRGLLSLVRPGGHIIVRLRGPYDAVSAGVGRLVPREPGFGATPGGAPRPVGPTIDEVLGWFDRSGVDFVRGAPSIAGDAADAGEAALFEPAPRGSWLQHRRAQLQSAISTADDGVLLVGRKGAR